jgi:hypothetical protein
MQQLHVDLWTQAEQADALCVTTNGMVTQAGRGVMGRGVAAQAVNRYPHIALYLGQSLTKYGNHVDELIPGGLGFPAVVSFPVKHHWREAADLTLIARSALELAALTDKRGWAQVVLPRPGCGNGRLALARRGAHSRTGPG